MAGAYTLNIIFAWENFQKEAFENVFVIILYTIIKRRVYNENESLQTEIMMYTPVGDVPTMI